MNGRKVIVKYLTIFITGRGSWVCGLAVFAFIAPSLAWGMESECVADKLLQSVDQEAADTQQLRNISEYNEAHFEKYKGFLESKSSEDGKTVFPAILDAVKDENGKVLAAIPSLQVIEMLNHVDFRQVNVTVNLNKMYEGTFGHYPSDSFVIGLDNAYLAGKVLAHTGDVPPTAQQIYDAIKSAELKGEWPAPQPAQVWHLHRYHGP
jgi:hypothetical protein